MRIIQRFPSLLVPNTSVIVYLTQEEFDKLNAMGVGMAIQIAEIRIDSGENKSCNVAGTPDNHPQ